MGKTVRKNAAQNINRKSRLNHALCDVTLHQVLKEKNQNQGEKRIQKNTTGLVNLIFGIMKARLHRLPMMVAGFITVRRPQRMKYANIHLISKGKGKGKGKSSKLGNNEKLEKISHKGERTKKDSSKNYKRKTHRNTPLEPAKSSSNSDSSNSWYSDKEDKPLKSKTKDRLKSSKTTKIKNKDKNIKIKKSKHHLAKMNGDNISRVMKDSQDDTPRSNSPSILTNSLKCSNEKSDDSSDSENSQILLTKKSNKRKTVFDSDTNSESLFGNEDNYSSSRSIKEQSNVEKENQLRKRLLKKLKRKKRSSKKINVSPTKYINSSLETKCHASIEKSPVFDYE